MANKSQWSKGVSGSELVKCPRSGKMFPKHLGAVSRRDNKTLIHPDMGQLEAFEDMGMAPKYTGKPYWKVKK